MKNILTAELDAERDASARRPRSATDFALSLIALGLALGLTWAVAPWHFQNELRAYLPYVTVVPCLGVVAVFAIGQFLEASRRKARSATSSDALRPLQLRRVWTRLCGVVATFGLIAFVYWALPEYHGEFYQPYWQFLRTLAPLAVLIPPYLIWADRRFQDDHDEYLEFGTLVLRGWGHADHAVIRHHLLSWLVKAFFLPLMTVYLAKEVAAFYAALQVSPSVPLHNFEMMFHLSYMTDLLFAVVGYTLSLRLFDSHTRSVEPTVLGWVVALMCYQPFYSSVGHAYLRYDDKIYWDNLLQPWPIVRASVGVTIVTLTLIYGLCTAAFGLRFSNLTHRGIITSGPYRFTKHPAYLSKNLSWWLISVPMFSDLGWTMALRNCLALGLVNLIYYARARTEERHLSQDPTYVAYALWIEKHGMLAPLGRWLPFMRYRPSMSGGRAATAGV